jgi:hypothetical protein
MNSINGTIIQEANALGVKYIDFTQIWNAHNTRVEDSRNVKKLLVEAFTNSHTKEVLVVIGAIGRSQHSASCALFFDITSMHKGITIPDLTGLSNIRWNAAIFNRSDI